MRLTPLTNRFNQQSYAVHCNIWQKQGIPVVIAYLGIFQFVLKNRRWTGFSVKWLPQLNQIFDFKF